MAQYLVHCQSQSQIESSFPTPMAAPSHSPPPPSQHHDVHSELAMTELEILDMRRRLAAIDRAILGQRQLVAPVPVLPSGVRNQVVYHGKQHHRPGNTILGAIPAAHGGYFIAVAEGEYHSFPATYSPVCPPTLVASRPPFAALPPSPLSPSPKQRLLARAYAAEHSVDINVPTSTYSFVESRLPAPTVPRTSTSRSTLPSSPTCSSTTSTSRLSPSPSLSCSSEISQSPVTVITHHDSKQTDIVMVGQDQPDDHDDELSKDSTTMKELPRNFVLKNNMVVLGKGSAPKEASGNRRLQRLVREYLDVYATSERHGKIELISKIVRAISQTPLGGGGFVRYHKGTWWEATDKDARVKVTSMFRDALHDRYKSSSKSKVKHRQQKRRQTCQQKTKNE